MAETMRSIRLIITSNQEVSTVKNYTEFQKSTNQESSRSNFHANLRPVLSLGVLLGFLLYAWFLTSIFVESEWLNGHVDGEPITVTECYICIEAALFALLLLPVMLSASAKVAKAEKDGAEILRLIDRKPAVRSLDPEAGRAVKNISFTHDIFFQDVTFRYPGAADQSFNILDEVTFKISTNEITTVVGDQSCGKSTILKLMHRLYDP